MRVMEKFGARNTVDLVVRARDWTPAKIPETDIALNTPLAD